MVCVDDQMGMLFNRRRQSRDRRLVERILEMTSGGILWVNHYTAPLFADTDCFQVQVDDAFLEKAGAGEYCFAENVDVAVWEEKIERIVMYRWNRTYPADIRFPIPLQEKGWRLIQSRDFPGHSHERITEEVYIR